MPTEQHAARIARQVLGEPVARVERFTTGISNWVYDVVAASGRNVVVRIMREAKRGAAAVHYSHLLRGMGVPLPQLTASHVPGDDDIAREYPWMVLERLPGTDLEHVYPSLSTPQKLDILDHVMRAQALVATLPEGPAFGFTDGLGPPSNDSWLDVFVESLEIARRRIESAAVTDTACVDRVLARLQQDDFRDVRPTPMLEDVNTWNVIIHDGRFQGIIDVDGLLYGDPLLNVASTRVALCYRDLDTLYADAWADRAGAGAGGDPRLRRRLDLYTAAVAVYYLGEQGQSFNRGAAAAVNPETVARLLAIVDDMLAPLGRI